jgi:two-component system, NarL family, sensor histidine kinase DesK
MSFGSDACDRPDGAPAGSRFRPLLTGTLFYRRSPGGVRMFAALIWLGFIVFPLIDAIGKHAPLVRHGLVVGGAALFVASYVGMVMAWRSDHPSRLPLGLFVVLLSVAIALTLSAGSSWGFLFTYCAACAAVAAPEGTGFYAVTTCSVLAGVTSAIGGADGGTVISYVASSAGIGLLMLVMSDLRLRNRQLNQARAELAQMAVAQERERFARDLHDLLGHSLSVITLKAELAGRMLGSRRGETAPEASAFDRAATEIRELEQIARTALTEVREAVSGYRQPTLEGELAGARMALSAAGIEADIQQTRVPLDPPVEAVLAWTVREGATNVIRHSGARHCTLRVTTSLTDAGVEVIDDGQGAEVANGGGGGGGDVVGGGGGGGGRDTSVDGSVNGTSRPAATLRRRAGGHGIAGLAERARLVNGTIEAGAVASGGYRLAVTVPVSHA